MKALKILVTGAGGFVGTHLTALLLRHGHHVSAMGLGDCEFLRERQVPCYEKDILDAAGVKACMAEVRPDAVIHLAAVANVPFSWEHPAQTVDVNIRGTVNVFSALQQVNPAAKFLSVGSSDEYGLAAKSGKPLTEDTPCQPQNPYSISKCSAEQLVLQLGRARGMNVICTRSFNHFGPGQRKGFVVSDFASQIAAIEKGQQEPVMQVGDLSASRDFTYVDDVVAAYAALVEQDVSSGVYNICSGASHTMQEVLDALRGMSAVAIEMRKDPRRLRPSEVPFFIGDPHKIFAATQWKPRVGFLDGLSMVLDDWRQRVLC